MSNSSQGDTQTSMFRREFRLGLVVYGGVSLAIYMNGVCREFYNAVRGRSIYKLLKGLTDSDIIVDIISGTSAGGVNGVLLSYALTNSSKKEVVDFKDFANVWRESGNINQLLRNTFASNGASSKKEVDSVLDGEGYYQGELTNAFQSVWQNRTPAPADEWFSDSNELDLFITGTDLLGRVYKAFDNTGQLIEVKDHRTVFILKHREGRKYPFRPQDDLIPQRSLAKLCRITSCFPVAFPVVTVKLNNHRLDPDYKDYEVDPNLVLWGQLDNRELPLENQTTEGRQLHFVDGGVLDNRPFSYTIREIYYRTAFRPVDRKLFYIDPSPDQFLGSPKFRKMDRPNILKTALDSLVGMPRYESIANDLQEIKDRNERVRRYKFLRGTAERAAEVKDAQARDAQARDIQTRAAQASKSPPAGQSQSADTTPIDPASSDSNTPDPQQIYLRCRLVGLRDRLLPLLLRIDQVANPNNQNKQELIEEAANLITPYVANDDNQFQREQFLHSLGIQIRNLDVDYALRKHLFFLEKLCQWMVEKEHQKQRIALEQLAWKICRQVELLEVVQAGLEYMLKLETVNQSFQVLIQSAKQQDRQEQTGASNQRDRLREQIYDYLLRLHRFLLDSDHLPAFRPSPEQGDLESVPANFFNDLKPPYSIRQLSSVLAQLRQKADQLQIPELLDQRNPDSIWRKQSYEFVPGSENDSATYFSLLRRIELASEALIRSSQIPQAQDLLKKFRNFRHIDLSVYAYEYLSDIQAKEQIEIFRISPSDAQKGFGRGKGLEEKLAGDQLRAFGGFFKKSWRSNDILWGRLDGVNRIVEALLTSEALRNLPEFLDRQTAEQPGNPEDNKRQYLTNLVIETLPEATPAEKDEILTYLLPLIHANTSLGKTELSALQELLIRAEHRAIVRTELGHVLEDAITEQMDWNQQQVQSAQSLKKALQSLKYQPVAVAVDAPEEQLYSLRQIDQLLQTVINPKQLAGIAAVLSQQAKTQQAEIDRSLPPLTPAQQQILQGKNAAKFLILEKRYLQYLMKNAFPKTSEVDRQTLVQYPLQRAATPASVDDLYSFLNRLWIVSKAEIRQSSSHAVTQALEGMAQQLEQMIEQIRPRYQPVSGYFDRAVTPFAAKELARTSTQALFEQNQAEDFFRNQYRIGSERVAEGIPSLILQNLAARTGLVLRDIVNTSAFGKRVRSSFIYRFIDTLLQLFYWSVRARSPKAFQVGKTSWSRFAIEFVFLVAAVAITVILVSKIPLAVMIALLSAAVLWLIYTIRRFFGW